MSKNCTITFAHLIIFLMVAYAATISFIYEIPIPRSPIIETQTQTPTQAPTTQFPTTQPTVQETFATIYLFADDVLRTGNVGTRETTDLICSNIALTSQAIQTTCGVSPIHMLISYTSGTIPLNIKDFRTLYEFTANSEIRNATNVDTLYGYWGTAFNGDYNANVLLSQILSVSPNESIFYSGSNSLGEVVYGFNCNNWSTSSANYLSINGDLSKFNAAWVSGNVGHCGVSRAFLCACIV